MQEIIKTAVFSVEINEKNDELIVGSITNHSDSDLTFTVYLKDANGFSADVDLTVVAGCTKVIYRSVIANVIMMAFKENSFSFTGDRLVVAREIAREDTDFSCYFDCDTFSEAGGENCSVYIFTGYSAKDIRFNSDDFKCIYNTADSLCNDFQILLDDEKPFDDFPYESFEACMEDYGIPYTPEKCEALKHLSNDFGNIDDCESMARYLTIMTGSPWDVRYFNGYSQGDFCAVLYCKDSYTDEGVIEIGKMWLGCGFEYVIDDCSGYFVTDDIQWGETEKLRDTLADYYGCASKNLVIQKLVKSYREDVYRNI